MATTKDSLKHISQLFSPSASSLASTFPSHALPPELVTLLDSHRDQFGRSFSTPSPEADKERARWREGLLEIWASIDPESGSEIHSPAIGRVSAFLDMLYTLSAAVKEDDDSAIVTRLDIAQVWWGVVLKRVLLGIGQDALVDKTKKAKQVKPSQPQRAGRPLVVSIAALSAVKNMLVWAMLGRSPDGDADGINPFTLSLLGVLYERKSAFLGAVDHPYGVANLEEVIISWAEKSAKVSTYCRILVRRNPVGLTLTVSRRRSLGMLPLRSTRQTSSCTRRSLSSSASSPVTPTRHTTPSTRP